MKYITLATLLVSETTNANFLNLGLPPCYSDADCNSMMDSIIPILKDNEEELGLVEDEIQAIKCAGVTSEGVSELFCIPDVWCSKHMDFDGVKAGFVCLSGAAKMAVTATLSSLLGIAYLSN